MTFEKFFMPLGKEYCTYYYVLSVFGAICFCGMLIGAAYMAIMHKNKNIAIFMVMYAIVFGISYFKSRMLYTMCSNSSKQ